MATFVFFSVAIVGIVSFGGLMLVSSRSPIGVFHPIIVLGALAIVDTFLPGLIWAITDIPSPPPWKEILESTSVAMGISYYFVFYLLLFAPMLVSRKFEMNLAPKLVSKRRFLFLIWGTLLLSVAALVQEVASYGSIQDWFWGKTQLRWAGPLTQARPLGMVGLIIEKPPWRTVFTVLVLAGFYHRAAWNSRQLFGKFFPAVAILLSVTTFYRGSVFLVILGLVFAELIRLRSIGVGWRDIVEVTRRRRGTRYVYLVTIMATLVFVSYGTIRTQLQSQVWETAYDAPGYVDYAVKVLSSGSGLKGISYIVQNYGDRADFRYGETYLDMLLLPVPRIIYTSKPDWYGITDITKAMGWPISTQEAVTMPGEAYANFGWAGLMVAPALGLLFSFICRICLRTASGALVFLYPGVVLYVFIISNWMSFTGVMNQFFGFVVCFIALKWVSLAPRTVDRAHRRGAAAFGSRLNDPTDEEIASFRAGSRRHVTVGLKT